MFKSPGRTIFILLVIGIGLLLLWMLIRPRLGSLGAASETSVPVDLKNVIPGSWVVQTEMGPQECDFDRDGEKERLVVYRYDAPATAAPGSNAGLIGAVIFDSQVNRVPQEPSVESPYRPAVLVPYKLLPDIYTQKGQGYLGETNAKVIPAPGGKDGCLSKEIVVLGTTTGNSNMKAPNFLSIFRWEGEKVGYTGVHYTGNERIEIATTDTNAVKSFITYDRLDDRSALCKVQPYVRYLPQGSAPDIDLLDTALDFRPLVLDFTISFCSGIPADPYYPEGVVAALLRGGNPGKPTPMGSSFLTQAGIETLPESLQSLKNAQRDRFPILSITNPGTLGDAPQQGYLCPGLTLNAEDPQWWCAREQVRVITDILVNGQSRQVIWTLISVANDQVVDDVHWRINHVEML